MRDPQIGNHGSSCIDLNELRARAHLVRSRQHLCAMLASGSSSVQVSTTIKLSPAKVRKKRANRIEMVVRKMKDKCKDAARMRREKERAEFVELSRLLPLPSSTTSQLDKASIIRLTSSYLRMRTAFPEGLGENWGQQRSNTKASLFIKQTNHQIKELGSLLLQTLDGFVFAMHKDGKIMYISETASVHLGLAQIDLTGSSVFEYVHPSDRENIKHIFSLSEAEQAQLSDTPEDITTCPRNNNNNNNKLDGTVGRELGRSFCMRMKCILPKRNAGLVSGGYKAIHCNGYLKVRRKQQPINQEKPEWESYALVAVGHSLLPSATTEVKLTNNSFMFRATLDFKFCYVESIMTDLLGHEQFDLIEQSLYQFVHVNDVQHLEQSHRLLLEKGQVVSRYFRLMKRDGGFLWIQSYASLVNNPRNMPKPQHIVSVCMILGQDMYDQSRFLYDRCEVSRESDENGAALLAPVQTHGQQTTFATNIKCKSAISHQRQSSSSAPRRGNKLYQIEKKKMKQRQGLKSQQFARSNGQMLLVDELNQPANHKRVTTAIHDQLDQANYPYTQLASSDNHADSHLALEPASGQFCAINRMPTTGVVGFSIGSTRRASDDSCSIVSSVASTSLSSGSSIHQPTESDSYLLGGYSLSDNCPHQDYHPDPAHHLHLQQFQTHKSPESETSRAMVQNCHDKISMLDHTATSNNQQPIDSNHHLVWQRVEEFSADDCRHYPQADNQIPFNMNQFVQVTPTCQPWVTQVCAGSFGVSDTPLNLDNHISSDCQHDLLLQQQQQQQQRSQQADEIYIETYQPFNTYANHNPPPSIHFCQVPQTSNLYTV